MLVIFIAWIVFIRLELNINIICIRKYAKLKIFIDALMPPEDTNILEFN